RPSRRAGGAGVGQGCADALCRQSREACLAADGRHRRRGQVRAVSLRGEGETMPIDILMPALSPTMTEGKLAKWLVKEGDTVKAGDVMAEIETDKATMEFEAVGEGRIGKILVAEGTEGVAVNTPIATLLADGEEAGAAP